jgi:nucleotide-binding universal stress UspA family protein
MLPWRKILCAVDFCDSARWGLELAAHLARKHECDLDVVYVHQEGPASFLDALKPASAYEEAEKAARVKLAEWRAEAEQRAGRKVGAVWAHGDPGAEVLRTAESGGYDLLVTGTHGRTGLRHVTMGSVAERVVRSAHCPVLVARRGPPAAD